jgi:hypothetical protein
VRMIGEYSTRWRPWHGADPCRPVSRVFAALAAFLNPSRSGLFLGIPGVDLHRLLVGVLSTAIIPTCRKTSHRVCIIASFPAWFTASRTPAREASAPVLVTSPREMLWGNNGHCTGAALERAGKTAPWGGASVGNVSPVLMAAHRKAPPGGLYEPCKQTTVFSNRSFVARLPSHTVSLWCNILVQKNNVREPRGGMSKVNGSHVMRAQSDVFGLCSVSVGSWALLAG